MALTQLDYFGKPENELTPTDVRTRRAWNLANMRNMENQFYQQKTGLMDEDLVEAYRYFVGRWWTNLDDEFRELLASEMQYVFSKSFMAYVRDAGEAFSSDP